MSIILDLLNYRMEESNPKKVVKDERPKDPGGVFQEPFSKKMGHEQVCLETPTRYDT